MVRCNISSGPEKLVETLSTSVTFSPNFSEQVCTASFLARTRCLARVVSDAQIFKSLWRDIDLELIAKNFHALLVDALVVLGDLKNLVSGAAAGSEKSKKNGAVIAKEYKQNLKAWSQSE